MTLTGSVSDESSTAVSLGSTAPIDSSGGAESQAGTTTCQQDGQKQFTVEEWARFQAQVQAQAQATVGAPPLPTGMLTADGWAQLSVQGQAPGSAQAQPHSPAPLTPEGWLAWALQAATGAGATGIHPASAYGTYAEHMPPETSQGQQNPSQIAQARGTTAGTESMEAGGSLSGGHATAHGTPAGQQGQHQATQASMARPGSHQEGSENQEFAQDPSAPDSWSTVVGKGRGRRKTSEDAPTAQDTSRAVVTRQPQVSAKSPTNKMRDKDHFVVKPFFSNIRPSDTPLGQFPQSVSKPDESLGAPTPPRAIIVKGWVKIDREYSTRHGAVTPNDMSEALAQSMSANHIKAHVARATKRATKKVGDRWRIDYFLWVIPGKTVGKAADADDIDAFKDLYVLIMGRKWMAPASSNAHAQKMSFGLPTTNSMKESDEEVVEFLYPTIHGSDSLSCLWHTFRLYHYVNGTLPTSIRFNNKLDFHEMVGIRVGNFRVSSKQSKRCFMMAFTNKTTAFEVLKRIYIVRVTGWRHLGQDLVVKPFPPSSQPKKKQELGDKLEQKWKPFKKDDAMHLVNLPGLLCLMPPHYEKGLVDSVEGSLSLAPYLVGRKM